MTTVAGNAPLHHTTANAIRVLDHLERADIPVAAGADRPLVREPYAARDVHGETGLGGPDLPPPARSPVAAHADRPDRPDRDVVGPPGDARRDRPADERRPLRRPAPRRGRDAGAGGVHGRLDRAREHDAGGGVQHLGRPRRRPARRLEWARRHHGRARRHPQGAVHAGGERPAARARPRGPPDRRARRLLPPLEPGKARCPDPRRRGGRRRRCGRRS